MDNGILATPAQLAERLKQTGQETAALRASIGVGSPLPSQVIPAAGEGSVSSPSPAPYPGA